VILPDVNVLIYAARQEMPEHAQHAEWLAALVEGDQAYAVSDLVLSGFIRVTTNGRIFKDPLAVEDAVAFCEAVRGGASAVMVQPGERHWSIFRDFCRQVGVRGPLIPDAYFAALAIEHDCTWITADLDFARFPGLRWRRAFDNQTTINPK
jgi:toxin-antitoxin system PIN domain toxin